MGTISEKLTYLNETKSKIKDNINLTGAGLTNQTPFRQYATDLKTALLNILNNGIDTLYNNFPKTTGRGTNISLNNTLQAPIRSVINGDTEQDGEPTPDNPKEIKSVTGLQKVKMQGKNYIDMSKVTARADVSINSISNEVINFRITNPNPSLLITNKIPKGTYKVRKSSAIKGLIRFNNANNTQVSSIGGVNDNEQTLIFNEDIESIIIYLTASLYDTTINLELLFSDLVVVNQNSDTSYEPYQTPQEYEINLGKNLLNSNANSTTKNGITFTNNNGIFSISGTATANTGLSLTTNTIILENNTAYTQSVITESGTQNVNVVPSFKNSQGTVQYNYFTNNQTKTTTDKMTLYSYDIYIPNGTTVNWSFKVQLEQGNTATSYSPYFTPIHLYENDQIIGTPDNWSIKHVIGEVVLDGSESGYQLNGQTTNYNQFGKYIDGKAFGENNFKSNIFNVQSPATQVYQIAGRSGNTFVSFNLAPTDCEYSQTGLKNWIAQHNIKLVYELAEPTTEPITNTELIEDLNNFYNKAKSYNGQTNISVQGDLQMILDVSAIIDE